MKKLILIIGLLIPFVLFGQAKLTYNTSEVQTILDKSVSSQVGVFNVLDYGAAGDGIADDTQEIQAANDAVEATGIPGVVFFPTGTYSVSVINQGLNVSFRGDGINVTRIKMKNSANAVAVIQTKGFTTLTGTASTGGSFRNYIQDMTIDGNKDNNTAGYGIRLYGKAFHLINISIENCSNDGLYTEYNGADNFSTPSGTLESFVSNISIQGSEGNGFLFKGPHDLMIENGVIFNNELWGWDVQKSINALNINTYLNTLGGIWTHLTGSINGSNICGSTQYGYGMLIDVTSGGNNITSANFGGAGNGLATLQISAENQLIQGIVANTGPSYGGDANTSAVKFTDNGSAVLNLTMSSNDGYWFTFAGGYQSSGVITVTSRSTEGTLFSGSINPNSFISITGSNPAHTYVQLPSATLHAGGWSPILPASNSTILTREDTARLYLKANSSSLGTVYGSRDSNGDLSLEGTSDVTKTTSYITLQPTGGNVGIGLTTPASILEIAGSSGSGLNAMFSPSAWTIRHRLGVPYDGSVYVLSSNVLLTSATQGNLDNTSYSGSALILENGSFNIVRGGSGVNPRTFSSSIRGDVSGNIITAGSINYILDNSVGSNDTYTATLTGFEFIVGKVITFHPLTLNTGACTLAINGGTAYGIKTQANADPSNSDMVATGYYQLCWNGSNWVLMK